jgi:hypothetical protein
LPSQFLALDRREKAFVVASIQIKMENDKKEAKEAARKGKKR